MTKNVTEEHLREIFGVYGQIRDLDVPLNRQCKYSPFAIDNSTRLTWLVNTNRGTAYILYTSEVEAESAIAHMHESQFDGVTINVSIVLPRRKFSPAPPVASRGANHDPRRGPAPRHHGGGPPPRRGRSPRGYGRSDGRGMRDVDIYRPRSLSRSRSPRRHRTRSRSYSSRSRSPPRRGGGRGGGRNSPGGRNGNRRRRSPSYSSYSSYDDRSRSRSHGRGGRGRR